MAVKRSRFQPPTQPSPVEPTIYRTLEPTAGINQAQPPEHLKPNEAWDMLNYTPDSRFLRVRSGATKIGSVSTAFANHTYFQTFAPYQKQHESSQEWVIGFSNGSVAASRATGIDCAWISAQSSSNDVLSAATTAFYDTAQVFDSDLGVNILIVTDGVNEPAKVRIDNELVTVTSLANGSSWTGNFEDRPRFCTGFDDRAILFSDRSSGNVLFWSDRGRPLYWGGELGSVAGQETLRAMRGRGAGLANDDDRFYILSDQEVWQGVPRRDFFAFDFDKIVGDGCGYPASVVETPRGVCYVSSDMRVHLAHAGNVVYVGEKVLPILQSESADTWALKATYDAQENAYALFYSTTAGAYANRCLKLNLSTLAWYKHSSTSETWTGVGQTPLSSGTHRRGLIYGGSDGSAYAFHSQQSTDVGRNINAIYETPAINTDYRGTLAPMEAWVEHESTATSAFTVVYSTNKFSQTSETFGGVVLPSTFTDSNFIPGTGPASKHPQFRFQQTNNVASKWGRVHLALRPYSGRWPG